MLNTVLKILAKICSLYSDWHRKDLYCEWQDYSESHSYDMFNHRIAEFTMTHLKAYTKFCNSHSEVLLSEITINLAVTRASIYIALSLFTDASGLPQWSLSLRSVSPFSSALSLTVLTRFLNVIRTGTSSP